MTGSAETTYHTYDKSKRLINIPSRLHHDSSFPFKNGDRLKIEIDGDKLIIEKVRQDVS